ncbi:hypothetical protein GA0070623_5533 [Micromonospora rifamycinica]|uniref:Uncharacterized protein n=1 Tax=Micromonospora rifamycinica TaxID=291594 RepID=A0A1C5KEI4_9ACTN|nr:hypothetical protein GA0070623_5533 [Micromonospora rifamycinica]
MDVDVRCPVTTVNAGAVLRRLGQAGVTALR